MPVEDPAFPASLRRHADFNRLWLGQAVSDAGSQVTRLALPLTAVLYLKATPAQVGLMNGATQLAFLGPMLIFGALMETTRKRPLMIGADLSRAAMLTLIPVLAWAGDLSMPVLYAVAFVLGCLSVAFDLAYRSYLPVMISPDLLLAGNSRLQTTDSLSQTVGPALGGGLVQLLRAPFALLADAASFVFSAASLVSIRGREPVPSGRGGAAGKGSATGLRRMARDIWSGLVFIRNHPVLRSLAVAGGIFNFFAQFQLTIFVLYAVRVMHLSGGEVGLVFAGFGVGGVLAAFMLGRGAARMGYGWLLTAGFGVAGLGGATVPFVPASGALLTTALFSGLFLLAGWGIIALNVVSMTLRQVATPASLQARTNASFGFALSAATPIAAVLGGVAAAGLGLRAALFITSGGLPLPLLLIAFSPVLGVRTLEQLAGSGAGPAPGSPAPDGPAPHR
jgi:predicted MFS family arabinose efflux permease